MPARFKFAVISDPHIALAHTIWDHPSRFHLVEVSIPALEQILADLSQQEIDFLLMPGDLTQHGEAENHAWLVDRLQRLPFPVYVVPGNHDIPHQYRRDGAIGRDDFPQSYQAFGYTDPQRLYYHQEVLPGIHLIGLNSNAYDAQGEQLGQGAIDPAQWDWLQHILAQIQGEWIMVMVHHNVIEHLPQQSQHPLGRRYMLQNNQILLDCLDAAGVSLIFTGHLHVQDIAQYRQIYEITTGSLVSYPHPYRVLTVYDRPDQPPWLAVQSQYIQAVPGFPDLLAHSRDWIGERSQPFMMKLLTQPPLNYSGEVARTLVQDLRYFWADVAQGDQLFDFAQFPPAAQQYFAAFSAIDAQGCPQFIDNTVALQLRRSRPLYSGSAQSNELKTASAEDSAASPLVNTQAN